MVERWKKIVVAGVIILSVLLVNSLFFYNLIFVSTNNGFFPTYRNVNNGGDQMVYFSLMRQASEGRNLLLNLYTNEPQVGLISPLWWFLGKLVHLLRISIPIMYYITTMLSACGLLLVIWRLSKKIFSEYWQRLSLLPLLTFGGGLGIFYINQVLFPVDGKSLTEETLFSRIISADLWYGEGFGFLSLRHSPLFILSQLSLLLFFWWIAEKTKLAEWWQSLLMGACAFFLSIIHPYDGVPLVVFIFVYGFIYWRKVEEKNNWFKTLPIVVGVLAAACYFYWLRFIDPSFFGWSAQNVTRSPYPLSFLAGYFWLIIPALYGSLLAFRIENKRLQWLVIWLVIASFLIFVPMQTQRRFGSGVYIPITVLAWHGWLNFWKKRNKYLMWFTTVVYFILTTSTCVLLILLNIKVINNNAQMTTISSAEVEALDYYKENSNQDDVLLTGYNFGNIIPAYVTRKVYIGHGHQTINWSEKISFVKWFYKNNGFEKQKHDQLVLRKINYVWLDKSNDKNQLSELLASDYFEKVFSNTKVVIYKVNY